jgi:DNA polymerase-3 subunit alpha
VAVKHGRKRPEFLHPVMEEVLAETHGVMVYQDQVMRILERLGGIELSSAYTCIKAISKKKLEIIAAFREQFIEGAKAKGLSGQQAGEVFALIEKFAGYGFNKSHSTAYALLAWQTAYLKTHHPVEFMAALLSGDIPGRNFKKKDALVEHVEDCRRMGIEVTPPDVNASAVDFSVAEGRILFGLSAVKGCGVQAAEAIVAERKRTGPYRDLHDFCGRLDSSVVNKTAIENLAKAGALDAMGTHRGALLAEIERAMAAGAASLADRKSGQKNLFESLEEPVVAATAASSGKAGPSTMAGADVAALTDNEMRAFEKEVLGYYVHSHPLAEHRELLACICTHGTADLAAVPAKGSVVIGGLVAAMKLSNTKQPRPGSTHTRYAMFDLEDMDGLVRTICWPEDYARLGDHIRPDAVVLVAGSIDRRVGSEETNLVVNEMVPIADAWRLPARGLTLKIEETGDGVADADRLTALAGIVAAHPGELPLRLLVDLADGTRVLLEVDRLRVAWSPAFLDAVSGLLGPGCMRAPVSLSARGSGAEATARPGPRQGRVPARA